jgi:hypothetical protein
MMRPNINDIVGNYRLMGRQNPDVERAQLTEISLSVSETLAF